MPKTTKKTQSKAHIDAWISMLEKQNIVHALAYVPYFIWAIAMLVLWKTNKQAAMHHIKYSALIALAVFILFVILNGFVAMLVNIAYLVVSGLFAIKAYNWEEIKVEILDTVEDKILKTIKK